MGFGEKSSTGSREGPATPPASRCARLSVRERVGEVGGACRARRVRGYQWKLRFPFVSCGVYSAGEGRPGGLGEAAATGWSLCQPAALS